MCCFFSSRRRHTRCALVTGVQTCALPIFYDPPCAVNGAIDDPLRVDYLRTHIAAVGEAIARGVDVRGYMLWSLLDNLEWTLGYAQRFGIVHVDFETQARTLKNSAHFYRDVIADRKSTRLNSSH